MGRKSSKSKQVKKEAKDTVEGDTEPLLQNDTAPTPKNADIVANTRHYAIGFERPMTDEEESRATKSVKECNDIRVGRYTVTLTSTICFLSFSPGVQRDGLERNTSFHVGLIMPILFNSVDQAFSYMSMTLQPSMLRAGVPQEHVMLINVFAIKPFNAEFAFSPLPWRFFDAATTVEDQDMDTIPSKLLDTIPVKVHCIEGGTQPLCIRGPDTMLCVDMLVNDECESPIITAVRMEALSMPRVDRGKVEKWWVMTPAEHVYCYFVKKSTYYVFGMSISSGAHGEKPHLSMMFSGASGRVDTAPAASTEQKRQRSKLPSAYSDSKIFKRAFVEPNPKVK